MQPGGQRWGGEGCSGTGRAVCVSPRCFPAVDKMSLGPVPLSSTSLGALLAGICVENPSPALRLVADVLNWAERHQIKLRAALQARSALPGLFPPIAVMGHHGPLVGDVPAALGHTREVTRPRAFGLENV